MQLQNLKNVELVKKEYRVHDEFDSTVVELVVYLLIFVVFHKGFFELGHKSRSVDSLGASNHQCLPPEPVCSTGADDFREMQKTTDFPELAGIGTSPPAPLCEGRCCGEEERSQLRAAPTD